MKRFGFLTTMALLWSMWGVAQSDFSTAQKIIAYKYADAENLSWASLSPKEISANFKLDGKQMTATFDDNGKWLETTTEMQLNELSKEAQKTLRIKHEMKVLHTTKIESGSFAGYRAIVAKDSTTYELKMDLKGNLVQERKILKGALDQ